MQTSTLMSFKLVEINRLTFLQERQRVGKVNTLLSSLLRRENERKSDRLRAIWGMILEWKTAPALTL